MNVKRVLCMCSFIVICQPLCLSYSETGSPYLNQAGLELAEICLPLPLSAGVKHSTLPMMPPLFLPDKRVSIEDTERMRRGGRLSQCELEQARPCPSETQERETNRSDLLTSWFQEILQ